MASFFKKITCLVLTVTTLASPVTFAGQAPLISAEEVATTTSETRSRHLEKVDAYLSREDVVGSLERLGVSKEDAFRRVGSLNDHDLAQLANDVESAPAGGIVGAIVFVFLVLLLTDILGFTKVYSFTRSIRR
jgi:hypothetical protein